MLLAQERVLALQRLQLRNLARRTGSGRFRQAPSQSPIADVLPPSGQHERMDAERRGHRLDCVSGVWLKRTAASLNSL